MTNNKTYPGKYSVIARSICFVLCVVLLLEIPPLGLFAHAAPGFEKYPGDMESVTGTIGEALAPFEMTELRTPNEKTIRMPDGTYTVVKYAYDVHYLENGEYKEYDNTFVESADANGKTVLTPARSDAGIFFPMMTGGEDLLTVKSASFRIGVSLLQNSLLSDGSEALFSNAAPVRAEVVNPSKTGTSTYEAIGAAGKTDAEKKTDLESITSLDSVVSEVLYRDILPYTVFRYTVYGHNVKENILLTSAKAENRWVFFIAASGIPGGDEVMSQDAPASVGAAEVKRNLNVYIDDSGNVIFENKTGGEIECMIPAGYMYDESGAFSRDVSYEIEETEEGWLLTVIADEEWIRAEERVFPVTVDPTFFVGGYSKDDLSDTYILEGNADQNCGNYHIMMTGYSRYDAPSLHLHTLIKINNLPELPRSAAVVSATLNLQQLENGRWFSYAGQDSKMHVTAKKITSSWTEETVTWNNRPSYSSDILDYITVSSASATKIFHIDVTSAVQDWYEETSPNYGVVLQSSDEEQYGYVGFITSDNPNVYTATLPMYTISYRDTRGLDDRWAYSVQNGGYAGTGYVNLFNGNLVFVHDDMSSAGAILPMTVSHVYNAYQKGLQFTANSSNLNAPVTGAFNVNAGYGWKLSICESIVQKTISGITWLVYNDADGTELYFADYDDGTAGNYLSEDGYALTITIDSSSTNARYVMKDDFGNIKKFNDKGFLTTVQDQAGNVKNIVYANNRPEMVSWYPKTGSAICYDFYFYYNSAGALSKITNARDTSKYVQFYYSTTYNGSYSTAYSGYLRKIEYSSGESCRYEYTDTGMLKEAWDLVSNNYLEYSTKSTEIANKETNKVSSVSEYGSGIFYGQTIKLAYSDKKTVIRDSGSDDRYNTEDDLNSVYLFDNYGRTVCTYVTDLSGKELYGTGNAVYNDNTDKTNPRKNNTLEKAASSGKYPDNLIQNGSFESSTGWTSSTASGHTLTRATGTAFLGSYALKFTAGAASGTSYYNQSVSLPSAGTYVLSAYVKTNNIVSSATTAGGIYLIFNGVQSEKITGTTPAGIQSGWQRISVTVTVSSATTVTASVRFANASGTAYVDCVQVEKADAPSAFNLVNNGALASGSTGWSATGPASFSSNGGMNSSYGILLTGNPDGAAAMSQNIPINRSAKETSFVLSGWAKGNGVSETDTDTYSTGAHAQRYFALRLFIYYSDDTFETQYVKFNPNIRGEWQYASGALVPSESNLSKTISRVSVAAYYAYNANSAYFDNISLTIEAAQIYTYDSKGNLTGVSASDGSSNTLVYSGSDLISQESAAGEKYTYTYNDNHTVKDVTSKAGVKAAYTYDNTYGCVTGVTITPTSGSLVISSQSVYTYYGNFVSSTTDARGYTTSYSYDTATGFLNYITNANNVRTAYAYDASGKLTKLFLDANKDGTFGSSETGIQYIYNNKQQLNRIIAGNTTYLFTYDNFGNMASISVEGKEAPLVKYTYGPTNGKLATTTYADGTVITNTYDELGRIKTVSDSDGGSYSIAYNGNGSVSSYTESGTGRSYHYEYDSIGRLIRYQVKNASGAVLSTQTTYDDVGREKSFSYTAGRTSRTQSLYYDQYGRLIMFYTGNGSDTAGYTYDEFERVSAKTETHFSSTVYSRKEEYGYYTSGNKTSTLVSSYRTLLNNSVICAYSYTYDALGNITSVKDGTTTHSYTYNGLGQIIIEYALNAQNAGTATIHTYDAGGNLTSKKTYGYEGSLFTDIVGQPLTYTYGDSAWGDLLTAVNGHAITYDANGNPLTYYNGSDYTFTWTRGRRLASAATNGHYVSYQYDANGIRVSKIVDGALHEYYYYGNMLMYETMPSPYADGALSTIEYLYDAEGSPTGIRYFNGLSTFTYYYVKNLQGDIVQLRSWENGLAAAYEYDAWGKVLSVKDASGNEITNPNHIGLINPIRYRGYYYDSETALYYLQSRYYDATLGRFISPDDTVYLGATGDFISYNLYAYCGNDPVNMRDEEGNLPKWIKKTVKAGGDFVASVAGVITQIRSTQNTSQTFLKIAVASSVAVVFGNATVGDVWTDVKNYRFFNTDETKVLNAKVFSSYKGTPVLKQSISEGSCSIFNTIFLSRSEIADEEGFNTVKHEWGHTVQQNIGGTPRFLTRIAIPSVIGAALHVDNYYSQPWERSADFFGGVDRKNYTKNAGLWAGLYFVF